MKLKSCYKSTVKSRDLHSILEFRKFFFIGTIACSRVSGGVEYDCTVSCYRYAYIVLRLLQFLHSACQLHQGHHFCPCSSAQVNSTTPCLTCKLYFGVEVTAGCRVGHVHVALASVRYYTLATYSGFLQR